MRRQFHSAAATTATALLLCLAVVAFFVIVLLPAQAAFAVHPLRTTALATGVQNLARAAGTLLLIGYAAGIVGWVATFLLRCDGMHRLASVRNGRRLG